MSEPTAREVWRRWRHMRWMGVGAYDPPLPDSHPICRFAATLAQLPEPSAARWSQVAPRWDGVAPADLVEVVERSERLLDLLGLREGFERFHGHLVEQGRVFDERSRWWSE